MVGFLKNLYRDEAGATAIEYGFIISLVSIAAIAGFTAIGGSVFSMLETVSRELKMAVR